MSSAVFMDHCAHMSLINSFHGHIKVVKNYLSGNKYTGILEMAERALKIASSLT